MSRLMGGLLAVFRMGLLLVSSTADGLEIAFQDHQDSSDEPANSFTLPGEKEKEKKAFG